MTVKDNCVKIEKLYTI